MLTNNINLDLKSKLKKMADNYHDTLKQQTDERNVRLKAIGKVISGAWYQAVKPQLKYAAKNGKYKWTVDVWYMPDDIRLSEEDRRFYFAYRNVHDAIADLVRDLDMRAIFQARDPSFGPATMGVVTLEWCE